MLARAAMIALLLTGGCIVREDSVEPGRADASRAGRLISASSLSDPVCEPEWREREPGLRHRSHCDQGAVALHLVDVDPQLWTLDAARVAPTTAPAVAGASGASFAINANFFDHERKTLGAIVSAGRILQGAHPVKWQSIFYTTAGGNAAITLPEEWDTVKKTAAMAVQAGPRLVVGGRGTDAARATPSLRSGVCLPRDDRVVFFVTAGTRLYDVQEMVDLAVRTEEDGGLGCRDAMLFDGGPSVQMHLEGAGISIEGERVPAFVVARPSAETARSR